MVIRFDLLIFREVREQEESGKSFGCLLSQKYCRVCENGVCNAPHHYRGFDA
ncbi:MAG: hypothetical protein F6K62_06250 [Sphaerospermopsis sp. SIO1G2]|nr:hypothetical protein [Sphaerospermopsis sp. SIO1G2]